MVGDQILAVSEDDPTGKRVACTVTHVYINESEETQWNLTFETELNEEFSIFSGENHVFYVDGKGWISAADLEEGDICISTPGDLVTLLAS